MGGWRVKTRRVKFGSAAVVFAVVTALTIAFVTPAATGVPSVRGYDGKTITIAGLGGATNFAGSDIGTKARVKRFNDTNEIPGVKIEYTEFADDKADPATATSEARRLVTQEGVFAIVPDLSAVNPGPFLNQQHVPYVGFAFDNTYCSPKPTTKLYGFGYSGCAVPADPPTAIDNYSAAYAYVSKKTGNKKPTIVLFSNDNQSGKNSTKVAASSAQGAGFKVVYAKGSVPQTASDYTPYVQDFMTANGGKQPDDVTCLLATQCLPIWNALKAAGFTGTFQTSLGIDLFAKALEGTVAGGLYNTEPSAGLTQMNKDIDAVREGKPVPIFAQQTYFAADMFIQALKKIPKAKITPEAVQKVLATQTWQIKGLVGPTKYPASTVHSSPACSSLLMSSGTAPWTVVEPYKCSSKTYKIDPKFGS
jgi:branched-chain amino acid transport system substrate-binding protein